MRYREMMGLLVLAFEVGQVNSQPYPSPMPGRPPSTAPLLYVQFAQPAGMTITLYQGRAQPRLLTAPCTIGMRPGYVYRMKLSDIPDYPGLTLCPTLDVRGSLTLPPQAAAARHPAPFILSNHDIDRVVDSAVITKLVYLEDPETAFAEQGKPGELIVESEMPFSRDLLVESQHYGRPLFGWRLGSRVVEDADLMDQSIQGTILFPGDKFLPAAAIRPYVPFACIPYFDPLLGPAHPREECLPDGGDVGKRAGISPEGKLYGLDPSDTVAEFSDSRGRRQVAISNRVCVCAPRFAALRSEMSLESAQSNFSPGGLHGSESGAGVHGKVPLDRTRQTESPGAFQSRERPSASLNKETVVRLDNTTVLHGIDMDIGAFAALGSRRAQQLTNEQRLVMLKQMQLAQSLSRKQGLQSVAQMESTYAIGQVEGLASHSQVVMTRDLTMTCEDMVPVLPDKPLVLRKWVKEHEASIGDVVTIFLRYSNAGGQPISDIAVSDSLTGRLEYVPGSAKSDRAAVFTSQQNEAGSVVLRWEIEGRLPAGESGILSFQARVR